MCRSSGLSSWIGPHLQCVLRRADELSDVLLRLTVLDVLTIVAGDINIHLERQDESQSRRFTELLASFDLQSRVQTATHDHGGWLDVVATRSDQDSPIVEVIDPRLSDHRLLQWTSRLDRPLPVYRTTTDRGDR